VLADIRPGRAEEVRRIWGLEAEIVEAAQFFSQPMDIACIATPDDTHQDLLEAAVKATYRPRLLLVEKPAGTDAHTITRIIRALEDSGCRVVINFQRRWIPGVSAALAAMQGGSWGRPLGGVVRYTNGFRHNASHGLDLLAEAFGTDCKDVRPIEPPVKDHSVTDPTFSLFARLGPEGVPVAIYGVDGRRLTIFEADLLFERGRLRLWDEDGCRMSLFRSAPVGVPGYAPELACVDSYHDNPPRIMALVWRNLADVLTESLVGILPLAGSGMAALWLQEKLLTGLGEGQ
jgi:predicted dehydrogenase